MTNLNFEKSKSRTANQRTGAIVPLVAVFLPVLLILAGFSINLSYIELTRTQLRIATDSASRAAGHTLIATGDKVAARVAAREAGNRNLVAGEQLKLADQDIVFGLSLRQNLNARYSFVPGAEPPNAVRIIGRRTADSDSGSVSLIVPMNGNLGTFQAAQSAVSSQIEVDIALVLDRSGSMAYGASEDFSTMSSAGTPPASAPPGWQYCDPAPGGSRWIDLTHAVDAFITTIEKSIPLEHVSLATYGSDGVLDVELTSNYSLITQEINTYSQNFCNKKTNIGSGMEQAISALTNPAYARSGAVKVMVVMTDGRHNTGIDPITVAHNAAGQDIIVYTITFSQDSEQGRMIDVANIGGGEHYHALNREELLTVFERIATGLPTLLTE